MAHVGRLVAGLVLLPLLRARESVEYDPWDRLLGPRLQRTRLTGDDRLRGRAFHCGGTAASPDSDSPTIPASPLFSDQVSRVAAGHLRSTQF